MAGHTETFPLEPRTIRSRSALRAAGLAFLVAVLAVAAFVAAFFVVYARMHDGRVVPGVSVAGIPLAGLDRTEAEARLREQLPSVSAGVVRVEIDGQATAIPYTEIGRDYRIDAALAEAFAVGRTGEFVDLAAEQLRSLVRGTDIGLPVTYERAALEQRVGAVVTASEAPAVDASVVVEDGRYLARPATEGRTADEAAAQAAAVAAADAVHTEDAVVRVSSEPVEPAVTTAEAEAAATAANAMTAGGVILRDGETEHQIGVEAVRLWIGVVPTDDGSFATRVDEAAILRSVERVAETVRVPAVDAGFAFGRGGSIVAVPGQEGRRVDVPETVARVVALLDERSGGADAPAVDLAVSPVGPRFTTAEAEAAAPRVRRVSDWTTGFIPGPSNFNGRNIAVPTDKIDGTLVGPGKVFDFWKVVGEVSRKEGYGPGGAIINGRTEPTGALAGGICSCSTTIFNAALRFGLEMGKRQNHYYYITRYPMGLDATVWKSSSGAQQSMSFRNDTEYPILIRGINRPGRVRFELFSVPNGRTVTFSRPRVEDPVQARDTLEYTDDLAPGARQRVEYPTDGFKVWVTRTVRDSSGAVIHEETYFSRYSRVDGVTLVGRRAGDPPDGTIVFVGA